MPKSFYYSIAASAALLLSACGDEVTEVTEVNEVGMKVIEKGEDLPSCSSDNEGAMIYAVDSAAAYFCVNRKWTSMKGEKGDQGEPGKDGKQGEQGDKGDKGEAGDAGSSCTTEALPDSSGFKVLCGGDSVGVVLNGATGEKGEAGAKGDQGDPGEKGDKGDQGEQGNKGDAGPKGDTGVGCSLLDDGNGSVKVTCGEGKSATTTTLYKAVCGSVPYDPETIAPLYCDNGSFYMKDSRDNQIYRVVIIGSQTWMAENLNYKTADSHCYMDPAENCSKYGRYYTWVDAMDSAAVFSDDAKGCGYDIKCTIKIPARGICPEGWHIPTADEWNGLYETADNSASALQAAGFDNWSSATDDYGFSARPAGRFADHLDRFLFVGEEAFFWGANGYTTSAIGWLLKENSAQLEPRLAMNNYQSVRCIKD